jgi:hypothetical protein
MNAASVIVLATVLALAGLAAWRVFRKGAPCECGSTPAKAGCSCCCAKCHQNCGNK